MDDKQIRASFFLLNSDPTLAEAADFALDTGTLLRSPDVCPVKDTEGNYLMRDRKYLLNGELVRIKDWKFGSGNLLDRYYWVWYIDSNLDDRRITIEARYPKGVFGGAEYPSEFVPFDASIEDSI